MAATAWHWTDPELRYRRAWELLRPGGHLAFWAGVHVFPPGGDPFFHEIQAVYDKIGEPLGGGAGRSRASPPTSGARSSPRASSTTRA